MEAPEYLDLDEIDFSDDSVYSVTSLKNIPELSRRSDGTGEDRQAPAIPWSRGGSSLGGGGIKPSGIAEVHSKFRPVKRVSPLKHQPETSDPDTDPGKARAQGGQGGQGEGFKEDAPADKPALAVGEGAGGKPRVSGGGGGGGGLFGELEHYDLDMDEILDVPYIKSSQQMSTLPRVHLDKRSAGGAVGSGKTSTLPHSESTQYCVLSPVKWSDMRKSKSMEPDYHLRPSVTGYDPPAPLVCSSSSSFSDTDKLTSRVYPDSQNHKMSLGGLGAAVDSPGGQAMMFPLPGASGGRQEGSKPRGSGGLDGSKTWGAGGVSRALGVEVDEESRRNQNIINIITEGQISLLPHLAAENLELIRDEQGNNLLHIAAWHGHADCLQHLTSLLGEDGLTERNGQQLTPAGLGVKNGHLECVRWMVSETEAIAELSCTREHPSLIHYAARYGQEKVLLWLLQFMQEQAISLDEVDQLGNSAVHVAAQYGHLTCIQTLVEYGSNVTVHNQQGERPSQSAERQGHTTCARYLVVVETCMSLASQVVKLTKQLNEQAVERLSLQSQIQRLVDPSKEEGSPSQSPSSSQPSAEAWPEMMLTAESSTGDSHWVVRQGGVATDSVLRQLLGKEVLPGSVGGGPIPPGPQRRAGLAERRVGLAERRELKLARLKQIMQRSLSESDSDVYPPEEGKAGAPPPNGPRPERPNHLPISESEEPISNHLQLATRKHTPSSERKLAFSNGASKSVDGGYNPSPTSDRSDPDPPGETAGEIHDLQGQKVATSPKSALKSPSSRRKTSQNLRLRVTFDEQVVHKPQEPEAKGAHGKESSGRTTTESSETWKRPFGTFRSIMESLSGNQSSNINNSQSAALVKQLPASGTPHSSPNRKATETKAGPGGSSKTKNKNSAV